MIEIDLSKLFKPDPPREPSWGVLEWLRQAFMPGCTHPGRKPGTACPICGECCG